MIVLGIVFIAIAYLGIYSGFTGNDPRNELGAIFTGAAPSGGSSGGEGSPSSGGTDMTKTNQTGTTVGLVGKLVLLPVRVCAGGVPRYVDQAIAGRTVALCDRFHVKVSSGYRTGAGTTHRNGGAADFVGTTANMKALYNYALTAGYAWVEPWHDATTVGVHGTTGAHVHISFVLPAGNKAA